MIDYHLHTAVTIDGKMDEESACERAAQMGIHEIAFTNHAMIIEPDYHISLENFNKHWENIQACQKKYPGMIIRLGLEVDYYEDREEEIAATIQQYEKSIDRSLDLVLGAVHHMKGIFFSSKLHAEELFNQWDIVTLYKDYFNLATKAVKSGLFDVMAHPDLIKKYMGEYSPFVPFEQYSTSVEPYLCALLENGIGLEVNTKGFNDRGNEAYPATEILKMYFQKSREMKKNPILTMGSDAHKVEDVGKWIAEGAQLLREIGFSNLTKFENHQPKLATL